MNDIDNIKVVLTYLLRTEPWSEAEMLMLNACIKQLGLRTENKRNADNVLRAN